MLEPSHALAWVAREAGRALAATVLVTLSGAATRTSPRCGTCCGDPRMHRRARRDEGHKLLVPYVTGGMGPDWIEAVHAVADAGADAVEIGIPFSDPMIDGPTIQEASLRALERGTTPASLLDELAHADLAVPLCVMTYYNIVFRTGLRRFARSLADAGVVGAIIPDLPLEEAGEWCAEADEAGVEHCLVGRPLDAAGAGRRHLRAIPRLRLRRRGHGRDGRAQRGGVERRGSGQDAPRGDRSSGVHRDRRVDSRPGRGGLRRADGVVVGVGDRAPAARRGGPGGRGRVRGLCAGIDTAIDAVG